MRAERNGRITTKQPIRSKPRVTTLKPCSRRVLGGIEAMPAGGGPGAAGAECGESDPDRADGAVGPVSDAFLDLSSFNCDMGTV